MKTKVTVYQDKALEWRWRMVRGGRIVADSGEGYGRRRDARRAVERLLAGVFGVAKGKWQVVEDISKRER